jgi:hypothetical protein
MSVFEGYYTVEELVQRNPQLTVGGVRHWLSQRNMNGLQQSGAILAPRRRLFIHEEKFFQWYISGQTAMDFAVPGKKRAPRSDAHAPMSNTSNVQTQSE